MPLHSEAVSPDLIRTATLVGRVRPFWAESSPVGLGSSHADDMGEEVDALSVEVASGAVVVLGGAGVGVAGEDLVRRGNWAASCLLVADRIGL